MFVIYKPSSFLQLATQKAKEKYIQVKYIYTTSEKPVNDCPEYTPIRNNYLSLITERFPGLAFLELSPFDKMQRQFQLDTNIGLFFDKIGKTMLPQMFLRRKSFLENNKTICDHCRSTRYGWYGSDRTTFFGWYGKPYHNFDRKK